LADPQWRRIAGFRVVFTSGTGMSLPPRPPVNWRARLAGFAAVLLIIGMLTVSWLDGLLGRRRAIDAFRAALEEHGLRATVRLTRGRDIDAACGQLAARSA